MSQQQTTEMIQNLGKAREDTYVRYHEEEEMEKYQKEMVCVSF